MDKLYESQFVSHFIIREKSLLKSVWKSNTTNMRPEQFIQECNEQNKYLQSTQALKLFADSRKFLFPISPELQEWLDNKMIPQLIAVNLSKWALIYPEELVSQLSVDQLLSAKNAQKLNVSFFLTNRKP